jgi:hypothetical protein
MTVPESLSVAMLLWASYQQATVTLRCYFLQRLQCHVWGLNVPPFGLPPMPDAIWYTNLQRLPRSLNRMNSIYSPWNSWEPATLQDPLTCFSSEPWEWTQTYNKDVIHQQLARRAAVFQLLYQQHELLFTMINSCRVDHALLYSYYLRHKRL